MKNNLLLILLIAFLSCRQEKEKLPSGEEKYSTEIIENPASASGSSDEKKIPEFSFVETRHHFGAIMQGEKVSYVFKFKNTGNADLVIASVQASCGCTVPEYSKEAVKPGGEGHVKVTYDSAGKHGMESKTVTVVANTVPATKVLTISAEIISEQKTK